VYVNSANEAATEEGLSLGVHAPHQFFLEPQVAGSEHHDVFGAFIYARKQFHSRLLFTERYVSHSTAAAAVPWHWPVPHRVALPP
jgi:hypothetical protein